MSEDQNSKRVKFESKEQDCESESQVLTVRANSRIHLCFHDLLLKAPFHAFPVYTHQLFDNEEIVVHSEDEKHSLKVEVHIDTRTLRQAVNITGVDTDSETYAPLVQALKKGVAVDATFHNDHHFKFKSMQVESAEERELLAASGTLVHSFTLKDEGEYHEDYECIRFGSDSVVAAKLLARAEKLAMWFIETADSVDFLRNPHWEVLFVYQKGNAIIQPKHTYSQDRSTVSSSLLPQNNTPTRTLVGHLTLFTFHALSAETGAPEDRVRICQSLVAPYKQGQGLGRELVLSAYTLAAQRSGVAQVTVEDPCVGFQRLRDTVDYEWALTRLRESAQDVTDSLAQADVESLSRTLKITPAQCVFVRETAQYLALVSSLAQSISSSTPGGVREENSIESLAPAEDEENENNDDDKTKAVALEDFAENAAQWTELERLKFLHDKVNAHSEFDSFRVSVKRDLLRENPSLRGLEKKTMQRELKTLFNERMVRYHHVLRALRRQKLLDATLLSDESLAALCGASAN